MADIPMNRFKEPRTATWVLVLLPCLASSWKAQDRSVPSPGREERAILHLSFSHHPESATQSVFLLGDLEQLGRDDVTRAIPMHTEDRIEWRVNVSVPADRDVTYGYWVRDHRHTELQDPRNGSRISEERTIEKQHEARAGGKSLIVHSTLDGPILHWRQDDGDHERVVLERMGPGRTAGEHRWRARGFGLANRRLQFFLTDREGAVREPLEGAYETPLDRMFVQDGSLFTYVPAPSTSPMRRDGGPRRLESQALGQVREYRVMLPRGYDEHTARRYPVLYLYDGQITWDPYDQYVPWDRDGGRVSELVRRGEVSEMILVAIVYELGRRLAEVTPPEDVIHGTSAPGQADMLMEFITTELKPLIDSTYRTRPGREATFMTGFSGGGLLSMLAAWEYHDTFGAVALQSAGFGAAPNFSARLLRDPRPPVRIYFDAGTGGARDPAGNVFLELSRVVWSDFLGDSPPAVLERDIRVHLGLGHMHEFVDAGERMHPLMTFLCPATLERDEELWRLTR